MQKSDVLSTLMVPTGGLLALTGEGAILGVPLLAASAYLFAGSNTTPDRDEVESTIRQFTH
ncbi:hypothetical protein [Halorussus halophilus]|uniref:hypothetical protein n=1 Tax=Halorussus halophilus TaxID=2650975 RepID=UPI001300FF07|nr:hypothetical protein [Halorussus halophilus]